MTLIELLVVTGILTILAALAIPQYATYKKQALDAQMYNEVHHARVAMEAFFEANDYDYTGATVADLAVRGYRETPEAELCIELANTTDYTVRSCVFGGNFESFVYSTTGANAGKIVGENTACSC